MGVYLLSKALIWQWNKKKPLAYFEGVDRTALFASFLLCFSYYTQVWHLLFQNQNIDCRT